MQHTSTYLRWTMNPEDFANILVADIVVDSNLRQSLSENLNKFECNWATTIDASGTVGPQPISEVIYRANRVVYFKFADLVIPVGSRFIVSWRRGSPTYNVCAY